MNCPRCQTAMTPRVRDEIEVDVCAKCGGVWLDGGELAKVLEMDRERVDAEKRANWRLYDRGRDNYDSADQAEPEKSALESLLGQ